MTRGKFFFLLLRGISNSSFSLTYRIISFITTSLLDDFKTWVEESKAKQLDNVTENVIKKLRYECLKRQVMNDLNSSSGTLHSQESVDDVGATIAKERQKKMTCSGSFQKLGLFKKEKRLIEEHFGIDSDSQANNARKSEKVSRHATKGVITKEMIDKTIEESSSGYFEEGSVMRNLIHCGSEVTWFSDRHPDDVIYCICVNRQTTTVTLVFHGQEKFISLCRDSALTECINPIAGENYHGNSDFIKLRSAVSDKILRRRRDTGQTSIDEIREKVNSIGLELANGGKYHLSITGHSLGGGFATVAGYYLASDPFLHLASSVRIYTFASAQVGCRHFQHGFQHLEESGRLMHARFTNSNDLVSLLPIRAHNAFGQVDDWYAVSKKQFFPYSSLRNVVNIYSSHGVFAC